MRQKSKFRKCRITPEAAAAVEIISHKGLREHREKKIRSEEEKKLRDKPRRR